MQGDNSPYNQQPEGYNPYNQVGGNNIPPPAPPIAYGQDAQAAYQNESAEFATDVNRLHQKGSSCHWQAFIATFILIGGSVTAAIFYLNGTFELGVMFGIIGGCYLIYLLVGCCCNPLRNYLSNIEHGQNFETYYEWIRNQNGHFWFYAECYHYETRHHTRTVTDSDGKSRTEHYTSTEKVVTHTATESLQPIRTVDESGAVDRIRAEAAMVFIHFQVRHRFADFQSQNNFNSFFMGFKMRHTRDSHQDFSYGYKINGLVERKTFFVEEMSCNYKMWFYLCGIVGLLWPYSLCVESKINRFDVFAIKAVTI
jgi:hypothetical protein